MENCEEDLAGTATPGEGSHLRRDAFFLLLGTVARHGFFLLVGVAGLLLVFWYPGPLFNLVHSYGGNLTAPFAFYFAVRSLAALSSGARAKVSPTESNRATSVLITLLVAELLEATDGFFGTMTNVYDPLDYLANAGGAALAVAVDVCAPYPSIGQRHRIRDAVQDHPPNTNAG